jgi:KDO2-lipid IV(A) lauroyltransferase
MPKPSLQKRIRYIFEAIFVYITLLLLKILPIKTSVKLAGFITEKLGPLLKTNYILRSNLRNAFPEKSNFELLKTEKLAWRNLGKLGAELASLGSIDETHFNNMLELNGFEHVEKALNENGNFIMVSGHIGNWEMAARLCAQIDKEVMFIYRRANNPYVEKIIQSLRKPYLKNIVAKGSGIKSIVKHIKSGGSIAMLVDQKFTGGTEVEFFGKKVSAPDTHIELAQKTNTPVIAGRVIRKENGKFMAEFKPIELDGKTKQESVQSIYTLFEKWISEAPSQWFWMHNRWGLKRKK